MAFYLIFMKIIHFILFSFKDDNSTNQENYVMVVSVVNKELLLITLKSEFFH